MAEIRLLPPRHSPGRLLTFIIFALAPLAFGALALWLGQDANWDLRNYHWYNAYALLNGRYDFDLLPSQTPWFYNPALDVPFYLLATHVPAKAAGFALGFVQGLNFILLFMLAYAALIIRNVRGKIAVCTVLATLGMLGGGGVALIGTTFYDNVTSLGYFLSALLVIHNHHRLMTAQETKAFGLALLFGLPAGLMMGLKLPGVVFAVGWCFGILAMGGSLRRLLVICFAFGVGVLLGLTITLGPWAWFLQTHFGSPLFPYFNGFFHSPLAPATSARDTQFIPGGLNTLLFPFIFAHNPYSVGEIPWRDWRIPLLYVLLPAALILRLALGKVRHQQLFMVPFVGRYLIAAGILSYCVWLFMFSIYRYAVPLEMIAPLIIVAAVASLSFNVPARVTLAAFILLVAAVSVQSGNWYRRAAWLDRFVEAQVPVLPKDPDLMILMAGIDPYSHVIPEFPHDIPFVRIQSNFSSPNENKGINQIIRSRVEGHQGPFILLITPGQMEAAAEAMAAFHLTLAGKTCQTVIDRLYDDRPLSLCTVKRQDR